MAQTILTKLINAIYILGPAALVLGFLIFVHELGHFIAARLVGIRVEVFSLGFGKRLFGFRRGSTDYRISAIPFGGYVRMAGENLPGQGESGSEDRTSPNTDPADTVSAALPDKAPGAATPGSRSPGTIITGVPASTITNSGDTLTEKSVPQRILVAIAGSFMNGVVAVLLTIGLAFFGINIEAYLVQKPVIAHVQKGSPAEQAGLVAGDLITEVGGIPVETWEDAQLQIMLNVPEKTTITVNRNNQPVEADFTLEDPEKYYFGGIGTPSRVIIGNLKQDSPAEKAGLLAEDEIVAIDGAPLNSVHQMMDTIQASGGRPVRLAVIRQDARLDYEMKPEYDPEHERYLIGISFAQDPDKVLRRYPAGEAVVKGIQLNLQMGVAMYNLVGRLIMGKDSVDQLGGPVMIVDMAGKAARAGMRDLIWLTALISLNLAVLNLLPVPILDGGMVVFLLLEALFRRPVSEKIQIALQNVFFFLLVGFALYVTYNDVIRMMFR